MLMEPADVLFQKLHLEINLWIVRSSPERLLFFLTFSGGMNLRWGGFQKSFCLLAAVGNFLWRRRSWSFSSEVGGGGGSIRAWPLPGRSSWWRWSTHLTSSAPWGAPPLRHWRRTSAPSLWSGSAAWTEPETVEGGGQGQQRQNSINCWAGT